MNRVILHIGRHKTGTTAIQKFLFENPDLLQSQNYFYPDFGIRGFGHHELGAPLTRKSLRESNKVAEDIVKDMRVRLRQSTQIDNAVTIISSESFQLCDPNTVRSLFSDSDVQVVVYLREQVSYVLSSYAQRIHATDYTGTLTEYYSSSFTKDYAQFLAEWESAFPESVSPRIYEKSDLIENNVVVDFCDSVLGLDYSEVAQRNFTSNANPSLTKDLLEYKLLVNRQSPVSGESAKLLYNGLAQLALTDDSGKIEITNGLVKEINKRFKKSNKEVARKYFNRSRLFKDFDAMKSCGSSAMPTANHSDIHDKLLQISPDLALSLPSVSSY